MNEADRFLGVAGYRPHHVESVSVLSGDERARFRDLRGRTLLGAWAVWETTDDEWFVDAPVVLDFGAARRLEIAAFKTHLCISWNAIDFSLPLDWMGTDFRLEWRRDALAPLDALVGHEVTEIAFSEYRGSLNGVSFTAATGYAELYNALDELGLRSAPDGDPEVVSVLP